MRYYQYLLFFLTGLLLLFSCDTKYSKRITLFQNGHFFEGDSTFSPSYILAVSNGKIVALGDADSIRRAFPQGDTVDLQGRYVYPGFHDAHVHFYGLGESLFSADLSEAHSWEEVLDICSSFVKKYNLPYLKGRGWDQTKWAGTEFPNNTALNQFFPAIPVLLTRVDGHAAICNDYLLSIAKVNSNTQVNGGEFLQQNGNLTGLVIDKALEEVENYFPKPSRDMQIKALLAAEKLCFSQGITSVTDAGLSPDLIYLIDSLHNEGKLHMRIDAMVSVTPSTVDEYVLKPVLHKERLRVGSFKLYADGALGSRGAFLLQPYTDRPNHRGFLLYTEKELERVVKKVAESPYQLNTHCIGDAANRMMIKLYAKYLEPHNNRRWRIEHAQIIHPQDYDLIKQYGIIPSVQPTHATSDMLWAEKRLGSERLSYAYAYHSLLSCASYMPLGTDAPVEPISPLGTFYAAVARKNKDGIPSDGFIAQERLTRQQALLGMTIWPAKASFQEQEKGSLDVGKWADFVILPYNLLGDSLEQILNTPVHATYQSGEKVYDKKD